MNITMRMAAVAAPYDGLPRSNGWMACFVLCCIAVGKRAMQCCKTYTKYKCVTLNALAMWCVKGSHRCLLLFHYIMSYEWEKVSLFAIRWNSTSQHLTDLAVVWLMQQRPPHNELTLPRSLCFSALYHMQNSVAVSWMKSFTPVFLFLGLVLVYQRQRQPLSSMLHQSTHDIQLCIFQYRDQEEEENSV